MREQIEFFDISALKAKEFQDDLKAAAKLTATLGADPMYDRAIQKTIQFNAEWSKIPAAIEESLRLDAVIQLLTRQCKHEVQLGDETLPAGARVVVGMASANRDERAFGSDADRLRAGDNVDAAAVWWPHRGSLGSLRVRGPHPRRLDLARLQELGTNTRGQRRT